MIAIAQAGVKLTDFNAKLGENGQWLPLDPPDDGNATLGGVVATGLGGAQQFGYGRPRGSVIGMKVVLANGNMIRMGGRVVKNVAGYDLCKLFTGSYGSLGIITELNFKLRPRPASEATVIARGSVADLLANARAILEARLFPVAAELVSAAFAKRLGIDGDGPALLIRFAGNEKGVAYQVKQAVAHLDRAEVVTDDVPVWRGVAAAPFWNENASSQHTRVLPSELSRFTAGLAQAYDKAPDESIWQIGALDGRVMLFGDVPPSLARAKTPASGMLMKRVKDQLDPLNIFTSQIGVER